MSAAQRRKAGTLGDAHTRSEGDTILVGSGSNPDTVIILKLATVGFKGVTEYPCIFKGKGVRLQ